MVARSEIERRVGDGIVQKAVGEAYATIADRAKIDPVLGDMFSVGLETSSVMLWTESHGLHRVSGYSAQTRNGN